MRVIQPPIITTMILRQICNTNSVWVNVLTTTPQCSVSCLMKCQNGRMHFLNTFKHKFSKYRVICPCSVTYLICLPDMQSFNVCGAVDVALSLPAPPYVTLKHTVSSYSIFSSHLYGSYSIFPKLSQDPAKYMFKPGLGPNTHFGIKYNSAKSNTLLFQISIQIQFSHSNTCNF